MSSSLLSQLDGIRRSLESLSPTDRLGYLSGCIQCVAAIAMSAGGWQQFLANHTAITQFGESALRSFFEGLRRMALDQLSFDMAVIQEHSRLIEAIFSLPEKTETGSYVR